MHRKKQKNGKAWVNMRALSAYVLFVETFLRE
jgi:hypothetical protein